jgi:hypothetical protein
LSTEAEADEAAVPAASTASNPLIGHRPTHERGRGERGQEAASREREADRASATAGRLERGGVGWNRWEDC